MDKFNLKDVAEATAKTKRECEVKLSNQAQNYFLSSFTKQAFDGHGWKEVQRRTDGTKAYLYPSKPKASSRTSPILVRTGKLRRAVSAMARTAEYNGQGFRMVLNVPYAEYLNDGTDKMAKREFVGQTAELSNMQIVKINEIMDKIWQV